MSSSKIPALPGQKFHSYISEKVGRYIPDSTRTEPEDAGWGGYTVYVGHYAYSKIKMSFATDE